MTREEAIKGLDRLKTIIWKESNMQIALNMAIEALDQVCENDCDTCKHGEEIDGMNCYECVKGMRDNYELTAEHSSDVISREEVKKQTTKKNSIWNTITDSSGRGLDEILDSIPSAQLGHKIDGDTISRQAAIDAVFGRSHDIIKQRLKNLPSAQPFTEEQIQTMQELEAAQIEKAYELGKADRPKWIPCSERMPKEREWIGTEKFGTTISDMVLVTFEAQGERFVKPMRFQNGELGGMDKHTMDAICDEWKAVAWMPLPEAYREDGEEE